ncbi:ankyrin repeat domain-containing protein, partial [Marinobacter sp. VGCF2001]|uniref:ankyrin repeat domain-containing protein n=1 Tax=Marinobacter sp. VGCF2001 TaxID=3417189 RepID=UPI003CF0BA01
LDVFEKSFEKLKRDRSKKDTRVVISEFLEKFESSDFNQAIHSSAIFDAELPVWMYLLGGIEAAVKKEELLDGRVEILNEFLLEHINNLSFGEPDRKSYTGILIENRLWASAKIIKNVDPFLLNSKFPATYSCIISTSKKYDKKASLNLLQELIGMGFDVNKPTDVNKITLLMKACAISDLETIKILLEYEADINAIDSKYGASAWMHAIESKYGLGSFSARDRLFRVLNLLIRSGADIFARPNNQRNFYDFVTKSKILDKTEKDKLRSRFEKNKKGKVALEEDKENRKKTLGAEDKIPEDFIVQYHRDTDFLLIPTDLLVHEMICIFMKFGINEFYARDISNVVNRTVKKWTDYKPPMSPGLAEEKLDELLDFSDELQLEKSRDLRYRCKMIKENLSMSPKLDELVNVFAKIRSNNLDSGGMS